MASKAAVRLVSLVREWYICTWMLIVRKHDGLFFFSFFAGGGWGRGPIVTQVKLCFWCSLWIPANQKKNRNRKKICWKFNSWFNKIFMCQSCRFCLPSHLKCSAEWCLSWTVSCLSSKDRHANLYQLLNLYKSKLITTESQSDTLKKLWACMVRVFNAC